MSDSDTPQPNPQPDPLDMPRVWATPAGVALCAFDDLADPGARSFVLEMKAGRFHGFVIRRGDSVSGYVDRCPHAGLPLAQTLDQYLTRDGSMILCSWHGALFRPDDGHCVGGPCAGQSLMPWPVVRDGSLIRTA